MIHLFKSAAARAVTYGLIALIAIGVMIGAVRLTLPFADLFRSQIAQLLSETLGMQVEMSRFRLRLAGMVPRLTLEDVDLRDPRSGEPQLELLRLHLDLDLAASLQGLAPKVESLTLEGARLQVERRMDGTIVIAGLDGVEAGDPRTMTFFLANGRFLLTGSDIHWVDHRSKAPALKLADVQIRFDNDGARHRIGLRARLAEDPDSGLHLAADLRGEADRLDDWSGDLYIDLRAGELHPTMRERIPALSDLQMGEARLQAWNRVERSRVVESVGLIAAQGLALGTGPGDAGTPWLRAERLDARLRWRPDDSGWELIIPELTLDWAGGDRTDVAVDVRYLLDAPGGWEVVADARGLTLEDLQPALSAYVSSAPLLEAVRQAAPRGQIDGVRLHLGPGRGEAPHWAAFGQIRGLQLSPSEPIPGISGLDVSFEAEREGVRLGLAGEDVRLAMPWLFGRPQPLAFDRFSGPLRLTWSGESGARLESDGLNLENPHLRLQTRLAVELPRRAPGPGLDLYGEIEVSDAGALRHYFPSAKLKPKLRRWLDQAFLGGRIPRGSFLFQGRPADFPFENGQGRFEAFLAADDLLLKFNSKWPPLRAVDGVAWFNNARMDVDISAGRLLDVSVEQAHAEIPDVRNARAILVDGSAIGGFDNALQILAETPLANRLGALPDLFRASGTARVDLSMSIPLRRHELADRLSLRGILSWPGPASLAPAGTDLELSALSGRLRFNQRGLDRSELEAELWGSPLTILMEAEPGGDGEPGPVLMTVSGATSVDTLSRHLPSPIWGRLRGAAPWRLDLEIPNALITRGEPTLDYALTSDLRGLTAELPAPMGKTGAESRRLRLEGSYRPGRDRQLAGRYGDLAFNLSFAGSGEQAGRLQRGGIAFGSPRARLPATDGVHLSGRIGELDLPPWTGLSEGGGKHPLRSADLKVDRLRLPQGVLTDARLRLRRSPDGWDVEIQAEELAGRLSLPHHPRRRPLRLALEHLDLKRLLEGLDTGVIDGSAEGDRESRLDPRRSHTLDLSVERLHWGGNALGRMTLAATAREDGLAFSELELDGDPLLRISGSGRWTRDGGGQETSVSLEATGDNLGEFLRHLGYGSTLDKAPAKARLELSWPGGPGSLSVNDITGMAEAELGKGSLLDVDPGVGRMLGVLNLDALQRRLSLDFSDLFQRGYAFERMYGRIEIGAGEARIDEMVIEGPAAQIRIDGKTDLVDQELAQVVTVTPSLGTSVALAGAVAGGPLVGAAVLIADKVSGGAVDKIGSYQYDVTGPWRDPSIVRRSRLESNPEPESFLSEGGDSGNRSGPAEARAPSAGRDLGDDEAEGAGAAPNLFLDP